MWMTTTEVLAIVAPVAAFLGTMVTLVVKRHFKHLDELTKALSQMQSPTQAIQLELQLAREWRGQIEATIHDLIGALANKIDDQRYEALAALVARRGSTSPSPTPPPPSHHVAPTLPLPPPASTRGGLGRVEVPPVDRRTHSR